MLPFWTLMKPGSQMGVALYPKGRKEQDMLLFLPLW